VSALYVTSLNDGDGKTAFCAGLAHLLVRLGRPPGLVKAVSIGASQSPVTDDDDSRFFTRVLERNAPVAWPASVHAAEAEQGLSQQTKDQVSAAFRSEEVAASPLIVEGPAMLTAEGQPMPAAVELADLLDARTVLLVNAASNPNPAQVVGLVRLLGVRLLGVVVTRIPRYEHRAFDDSLITPLRAEGVPVLGALPESRLIGMGVSVERLADHLQGECLGGQGDADQLVDHLMIGGMVLDSGVAYFSQNERKAVVVRGDRPDIQMAALSTRTRCLILTGGHRPIQYVEHEATEEDTPVILVQGSTLDTVRALAPLFDEPSAHLPEKADCFGRLIEEEMDVEALEAALR
jgi:BioD-like phosphotransacetylase family protein